MEREVGPLPQGIPGSLQDERDTPAELLGVRTMLLSLPRRECPVGFEFRLQRRIAGLDTPAANRRPVRGWALGWTGVGLGFAAALVIAVFAFDMNFSGLSVSAPMASNPVATETSPQIARSNTQVEEPVTQPDQTVPLMADDHAANKQEKDSARAKQPTSLPDDLYHVVGGSGR